MTEIFDDINKIYQFSKPCEKLAEYIEFFSESSFENTSQFIGRQPFSVRMFPSWTPTIWINLGAPYLLQMSGRTFPVQQDDDILVLRNVTVTRQNLPSDHIFTIKFFPGGLETILGINQPGLINRIVNVSDIMPGTLIQRIKKKSAFEGRMVLLEEFFIQQLKKQTAKDHYIKLVTDSIDFYCAPGMKYNTSEVAEKMFVTSKTINRYFNNIVGTSPKKYFSIIRARKALAFYRADKKTFDPGEYGYYDMSHFYKEVVNFTGRGIAGYR
jgi:AraC-like DNA-binding protein